MTHPATMRAVITDGGGGPEVLKLVERPVPQPDPGEILVRVHAGGINRPDVFQRLGNYPPPPGASDILGLEIAGEVVACGEGATDFAVGDRVMALVASGGYAEYAVVAQDNALPVPEGLSMVEAGAIPETYFTVWTNMFDRGGLRAGETVLIHGGSSGIGTTAIQLGKAFGATVFVTAGSPEKMRGLPQARRRSRDQYREEGFPSRFGQGGDRRQRVLPLIIDMVGRRLLSGAITISPRPEGRIVQIRLPVRAQGPRFHSAGLDGSSACTIPARPSVRAPWPQKAEIALFPLRRLRWGPSARPEGAASRIIEFHLPAVRRRHRAHCADGFRARHIGKDRADDAD